MQRSELLLEEEFKLRQSITDCEINLADLATEHKILSNPSSKSSLAKRFFSTPARNPGILEKEIQDLQVQKKQLEKELDELKALYILNQPKLNQPKLIVDSHFVLEKYPTIIPEEKVYVDSVVQVGDLHGNVLKFIAILIKHQILFIDPAEYRDLVDIYKTPIAIDLEPYQHMEEMGEKEEEELLIKLYILKMDELTQAIKRYKSIIYAAVEKVDPNEVGKVRLLGDLLADRGTCDYFTLLLIEALASKKDRHGRGLIEVILASNHDNVFLLKILKGIDFWKTEQYSPFKQSLVNLEAIIEYDLVTEKEIRDIIDTTYIPLLQVINYSPSTSLSTEKEEKTPIEFFTHAPTLVFSLLQQAAEFYKLEHKLDGTLATLLSMIDAVNTAFITVSGGVIEEDNPLSGLIWDRGISDSTIIQSQSEAVRSVGLPTSYDGHPTFFSHGHDLLIDKTETKEDKSIEKDKLSTAEVEFKKLSQSCLPHMTNYDNLLGRNVFTGGDPAVYFTTIRYEPYSPKKKAQYAIKEGDSGTVLEYKRLRLT